MLSNPEEFKTIMSDLRKLPEKSDEITAYGSGSYLGFQFYFKIVYIKIHYY